MKNVVYILVLFFTIGFVNANETNEFVTKARDLRTNQEFKLAIKFYIKAIKNSDKSIDLAKLYFEVSDCYYQLDNKKKALQVIKEAIVKYGVTNKDIAVNKFLDSNTNQFLLDNIGNYNKLRQKYVANIKDIDAFLQKNKILAKK